jgi:hypothetical protein
MQPEPMACPPGTDTSTAIPIDKDAKHVRLRFIPCYKNYCLIHKGDKDNAWYSLVPPNGHDLGIPYTGDIQFLEPLLPYYASHDVWTRPQAPILSDSGCPIWCPVIRPAQGLSFANGNDISMQG